MCLTELLLQVLVLVLVLPWCRRRSLQELRTVSARSPPSTRSGPPDLPPAAGVAAPGVRNTKQKPHIKSRTSAPVGRSNGPREVLFGPRGPRSRPPWTSPWWSCRVRSVAGRSKLFSRFFERILWRGGSPGSQDRSRTSAGSAGQSRTEQKESWMRSKTS